MTTPRCGVHLQAYFHPNNVVVIGLTVLHRSLRSQSHKGGHEGPLALQNSTAGPDSTESAGIPNKPMEVKYSQVRSYHTMSVTRTHYRRAAYNCFTPISFPGQQPQKLRSRETEQ